MPKWVRNSSISSRSGASMRGKAKSATLMTAIVSSETVARTLPPRRFIEKEETMAKPPAVNPRDRLRAFAPKLIDLTDNVLFGDVWERPGLSKRDRSLITCAALVALNRTEQQTGHFQRAINNGVKKEELLELITHLAFYGGWPVAMSAANVAKKVFEGEQK